MVESSVVLWSGSKEAKDHLSHLPKYILGYPKLPHLSALNTTTSADYTLPNSRPQTNFYKTV